jgi:trk system potassium uptake protein
MELLDWVRARRPLSHHTRVVLTMTAGTYIVALLSLMLLQWQSGPAEPSAPGMSARHAVVSSSAIALNSRSLGWPVDGPAAWPRTMPWIVMILMLVGASPAGTGGGIKTTTVYALGRGVFSSLRGRGASRIFGIAVSWIGLYLLVVLITTLMLASTEPQLPADQLLFIAGSAVGNVGWSTSPISITGSGMYTLSGAMMAGRLMPLMVLWWAALTTGDADVAVG